MVVLHLLQSNKFSGAENVVCQIIELFRNEKNVRMIYVCQRGSIKEVLERKNIEYVLLDKFSVRKIKSVVKRINPDIVHAHDFSASVMAARCMRGPVISHIHCNPLWLKRINIKTIIYAICSCRYKKIIGVSSSVKDEYIFKRLIEKKFIVIGNVIDKKSLYSKIQDEKLSRNIDLLFVGRLTEPKNPHMFLEIVNELKQLGYRLNCTMIGDGELKEQCETYINDNGLGDHVNMLGFLENPYVYMKRAKILVMPSKWEGFGLVAVEAMLFGTPVVCSGAGGLANIVTPGAGYICFSKQDYINMIVDLLENSALYRKVSECAIKSSYRYTDMSSYKECVRWCYDSALKK